MKILHYFLSQVSAIPSPFRLFKHVVNRRGLSISKRRLLIFSKMSIFLPRSSKSEARFTSNFKTISFCCTLNSNISTLQFALNIFIDPSLENYTSHSDSPFGPPFNLLIVLLTSPSTKQATWSSIFRTFRTLSSSLGSFCDRFKTWHLHPFDFVLESIECQTELMTTSNVKNCEKIFKMSHSKHSIPYHVMNENTIMSTSDLFTFGISGLLC